jgi:hypothetical protein
VRYCRSQTQRLDCGRAQVEGVDFRFQAKMRWVGEYMQYREMPAELKRKVHVKRCTPASGRVRACAPVPMPWRGQCVTGLFLQ